MASRSRRFKRRAAPERTTAVPWKLPPLLPALLLLLAGAAPAAHGRGVVIVALRDMGVDELDDGWLRSSLRAADKLRGALPGEATAARAASADTRPGLAGLLSGKIPVEGHAAAVHERLLEQQAATVAHFGTWPWSHELDAAPSFVREMEGDGFEAVLEAAESFIANLPAGEDFLVTVAPPRLDKTVEGAPGWDAGVEGVNVRSDSKTASCPDVYRGDNSDYERRYEHCPLQFHRANRAHELVAVASFFEGLPDDDEVLSVLTSTCGPESEQIDGHASPTPTFRGLKRSLYDGGLRVPLLWKLAGANTRLDQDVSLLDLAPTALAWLGLDAQVASAGEEEVPSPGVSLLDCMRSGGGGSGAECQLARPRPLTWALDGPSPPGHCLAVSPRFSVLMGPYKLLADPVELFDLRRGRYEQTNLAEAVLESSAEAQAALEAVRDRMLGYLQTWARFVGGSVSGSSRGGACAPEGAKLTQWDTAPEADQLLDEEEEGKGGEGEGPAAPRGIVLILADDMGAGDVAGLAGAGDVPPGTAFEQHTPVLDRLMRESVVMPHFYADSPVCSPSRAALMTGLRPSHAAVGVHNALGKEASDNGRKGVANFLGEEASVATLPRVLKEAGYVTAHFGKWHLGYDYDRAPEADVDGAMFGLDEYQIYGYLDRSSNSKWLRSVTFPTASSAHPVGLDNQDLLFSSYVQSALVNRTLAFVNDRVDRGERFFVNLWLQNPHAPFNLALDFDQAAANGLPIEANPAPRVAAGIEPHLPLQIYQTLLRDQEREVGRLVDALDSVGDVLVIYTADNGPEDVTLNFAAKGSSEPFRGRKRSLFEGGLRVPFLARWPGVLEPRVVTTPASLIDVLPTLAALAGAQDAVAAQGTDLTDVLLGRLRPALDERPIFFEYRDEYIGDCLGVAPRFALRRGRYKLLWENAGSDLFPDQRSASARMELYDVVSDPAEHTNLLLTHPASAPVLALAASMRDDILAIVADDAYDRSNRPSGSWWRRLNREDRTGQPFELGGECPASSQGAGQGPIEVALEAVQAQTLPDLPTPEPSTSPTLSPSTPEPTTGPDAGSGAPSASPVALAEASSAPSSGFDTSQPSASQPSTSQPSPSQPSTSQPSASGAAASPSVPSRAPTAGAEGSDKPGESGRGAVLVPSIAVLAALCTYAAAAAAAE